MIRGYLLIAAMFVVGCGRSSSVLNLPKPDGLPAPVVEVEKTTGFSAEARAQYHLGPETTWAGYSKAFSVQIPSEVATPRVSDSGFSAGSFTTPSGARTLFTVLDPVDYKYQGQVPKRELEKARDEVLARAKSSPKPGTIIANGWVGEREDPIVVGGKAHQRYMFFSDTDYLQINLTFAEGDKKQEEEARTVMAYGLWSIKIKQ